MSWFGAPLASFRKVRKNGAFDLAKSQVHQALAATQNRAQGNLQNLLKIVQRCISGAGVFEAPQIAMNFSMLSLLARFARERIESTFPKSPNGTFKPSEFQMRFPGVATFRTLPLGSSNRSGGNESK